MAALGVVEALGHRVVEAIAAAAHRLNQARFANASAVGQAGVLAALIGVSDGALGLAAADRHLEGLDHQLGVEASAHGPAGDSTREDVEDDGQVEPALPGSAA